MKKSKHIIYSTILTFVISIIPMLIFKSKLPSEVPIHWGMSGNVNGSLSQGLFVYCLLYTSIPKGVLKNNIYVFPYILTLLVGACCSTQVSLSLEGKCVWIKKMIPVSNSTVYFEKVMVGLLLTFPVAIVSAIFILVSENIIIRDMFFTLIIIVLNLLLMSLIGILIDIKFVNYNWNNPTSVIKRSSGAIVYQITNILMNSIFILLVIRFKQTAVIRGICICLTIILLSYIYRIIVKKSIPD